LRKTFKKSYLQTAPSNINQNAWQIPKILKSSRSWSTGESC